MNQDDNDIEKLLADILDDTKPLPTHVSKDPQPTPSMMDVAVAADAGTEMVLADNNMSDQDFLESLMSDTPPTAAPPKATITKPIGAPLKAEFFPNDEGNEQAQAEPATGVFADSADREEGVIIQPLKMPAFAPLDFASTIDIRNFATLVTLNTARWHGKVKDRQASKDAATMNDADEKSFTTRKNLLVGADTSLRAVHKTLDGARARHYEMTVPWTTTAMHDIGRRTGGRLLPNTLFVEYTTVMAGYVREMNKGLDVFEPLYPQLIEDAKVKLGKRFDRREYPNISSIRSHFGLSFDFEPIPKGDDFKGLPQAQLDALANKINANMQLQAEHAMQDIWTQLYEAVDRMAERLASPDKIFHDTLVQNVRDRVRLMAHLNVTNDTRVEELRKKVEKELCQHEPKELRTNPTIRRTIAARAKSIIEAMNK
jgi:hypothetical protein